MKLSPELWYSYRHWHRDVISLSFVALTMFLAAPFAEAQSTGGRIRGTVSDPSGASVAAATVTLLNEATHATRDVQSGANGEYIFIEVPVGTYEIDVAQAGFKKFVRKGIALDLNEVIGVDITLQLGSSAESVEVTGAPPVVDTTSTQLGAVVNERSTTQLPLNKRDPFQLLQLQPGVQSQIGNDLFFGSDKAGVVTVNGGRGRSNNYSVNGGDSNDLFANLPAVQPSPDSIEEFRVLSNTFDAEYGRNSGSVINVVTKSGTNNLHGSVYEFFRNDVLNAHGFSLNPTPKPPFKQNQFGGTLGGPVKKDGAFFFASYEGRRIVQGIVSQQIPVLTPAQNNGDFSSINPFGGTLTPTVAQVLTNRNGGACANAIQAAGGTLAPSSSYSAVFPGNIIPPSCFDPVAKSLLQYLPAPNASGFVQDVAKQTEFGNQAQGRFDYSFSNSQKTSIYYYYDNSTTHDPFARFQQGGAILGNFGGDTVIHAQQLNASHTSTIGSAAVNEFRFTWFREAEPKFNSPTRTNLVTASCGSAVPAADCFGGNSLDLGAALPTCPGSGCGITPGLGAKFEGVPEINFNSNLVLFGNNFEGQLPQTGNTFQFSDNYSKIIGSHSFKFGGDIRYQKLDQNVFFNVNGEFFYNSGSDPLLSDNLYADYLLGLPSLFNQGSGNAERVRGTSVYLFAQDSWKIKPSLTLNYGLRWEMNTPLTDTGKKVQTFRAGQNSMIYTCDANCASLNAQPTGLVFPGDKSVPTGLTNIYWRAFAPRLGLNWSPGWRDGTLAKLFGGPGKTSVSMGWGLFYNPIEQLVLEQFVAQPPFGISGSVTNPLFSTPFVDQSGNAHSNGAMGIRSPAPGPIDFSLFEPMVLFGQFPANLRTQYSAQYNLTIKRQLPADILFQVGYVGSQGHRLLATRDLNIGNAQTCFDLAALGQTCGPGGEDTTYNFTLPANSVFHLPYAGPGVPCNAPAACTITGGPGGTPITLPGIRAFSAPNCNPVSGMGCPVNGEVFSSILAIDNLAYSNYNSLQALLEKHFLHGIQFQAAYTFSKSLDNASSFEEPLNPLNSRSTYGPSLFDARHRFVFNTVWELPVPKIAGFKGKLLDGWQLSAIYTYQTGFPIRISSTADNELQGSSLNEFTGLGMPNLVGQFVTQDPKNNNGFVFNPALFDNTNPNSPLPGPNPVQLGTFGNSPRTLCCNPPINNWDTGFFKDLLFGEKLKMELRTEVYNIWNHSQFYDTDGNTGDPTFGKFTKVRDPRLLQFALKVIF
jgi:hypothetical protein